MAASFGIIPATLFRVFYRLSQEEIIAVNSSDITLLDCDRLEQLSQLTDPDDDCID